VCIWIYNIDEVHQPPLEQSKSPVMVRRVLGEHSDILSQAPEPSRHLLVFQ
jgi:hypothetical protein